MTRRDRASISEPPSAARQSSASEPRRATYAAPPSDPAGGGHPGPQCTGSAAWPGFTEIRHTNTASQTKRIPATVIGRWRTRPPTGALALPVRLDGDDLRDQALADADHLALLHAIWTAETTPAREQHYRDLLTSALPPGYHAGPSHQARWLWRTLRAAELAGLNPAQVLADAIAERDLAGARDIPAVLDARIRHRTGSLVPLPPGPWTAQVPALTDPDRRAYTTRIAALMDARKERIGEHAAGHPPRWAINALGPVPAHPADRLDWQRRASSIGAWR